MTLSKAQKFSSRKLLVLGLVIALVLVMLKLAFWQLDRAAQKEQLLEQWNKSPQLLREPLSDVAENVFQKVTVAGSLRDQRYFLLDNKTRKGRVGYEVLAPFKYQQHWLIVNLGWVAGSVDRKVLPQLILPEEPVQLTGWLKKVESAFKLKDDQWQQSWPVRIQQVDLKKMQQSLGIEQLGNYILLVEDPLLATFITAWRPVNMSVEKHQAYALQWLLMALVLSGLTFRFIYKQRLEMRATTYEQ